MNKFESTFPGEPTCNASGCERFAEQAGFCSRHYQQIRIHGRLTPEREYMPRSQECEVPGCDNRVVAKARCMKHYQQMRRRLMRDSTNDD